MTPVYSLEDLDQALTTIRRKAASLVTNFFIDRLTLGQWIARKELMCWNGGDVLLLHRPQPEHHFCRLYFAASSTDALSIGLGSAVHACRDVLVTDLIGPADRLSSTDFGLRTIFLEQGFVARSVLHRMVADLPLNIESRNDRVTIATAEASDLPEIRIALLNDFDPLVDQFPDTSEWQTALEQGLMLVGRVDGEFCGFLQSEPGAGSCRIRYWSVVSAFRGCRIGSALMQEFCRRNPKMKRIQLWVKEENEAASALYRHYGFRPEGLVDYVVFREGQTHGS
ncbi:MAG: GNAT family N-acetyltransferase [Planctomyces sp.]